MTDARARQPDMTDQRYEAKPGRPAGALGAPVGDARAGDAPAGDARAGLAVAAPARGAEANGDEPHVLTLRFASRSLEAAFLADFFRRNLAAIRAGYVLGMLLWVVWGLIISPYLNDQRTFDVVVRYGILIPILVVPFALTFTRFYARRWEAITLAVLLAQGLVWVLYAALIKDMPLDFGYVGVILVMTFSYTLVRLRFILVTVLSAIVATGYLVAVLALAVPDARRLLIAGFYLLSFWFLGVIGSYTLERSSRLLFLRERQLDRERLRSDGLLLNVLPQVIVDRLKLQQAEAGRVRIADGFGDVSVLFADAVGFTEQAERIAPDNLVDALDTLFTRFDELADRHGLEKIKTAGDAYMAAAGVPVPRADHAVAAAEMALAILETVRDARWPSGDPIEVRIGIAAGPVVAGVIGRRKFAYDLWGDTVNLASRLESQGEAGRILVSEGVADRLRGRFRFGPFHLVDLKGKGPTAACFLLGRVDDDHSQGAAAVADA